MPTNLDWGTAAFDVTADGSRIGGRIYRSNDLDGLTAGLWTEETGLMLPLQELLTDEYGLGAALEGWQLTGVHDMTDDGRFMVGTAINPAGEEEAFLVDMGVTLAADLTGNGFVDFEDLTVLLANWNKQVGADAGNLVNADTTPVNFEDLTVLLADWTGPGPAGSPEAALGSEAVPEPSTFVLLVIATPGLSFYRRRKRRRVA
ncbi:MAG: PEP-CTERM sorting domain-containing protein [Planctomycetes bacterium]|nr:PEP-CTERM sorting domain-containing protein [Planctomycetota bacterium]